MTTPENGIYVLQGVVPAQIAAAPVAVKVVDLYNDNGQLFTQRKSLRWKPATACCLGTSA